MDQAKRVNMEQMVYIKNCFDQDPLIQMCKQMIHNQLLNNGIKFSQGSKKSMNMDIEEEDMVENRWVPFCANVIDSVLCFGFAVVYMGKCAPSVMKMDTYWLKVKNTTDHLTEFIVYEKGAAENVMKNCYVFNHFGFDPSSNGRIISPMTKVVPRLQFLKNLRQTTLMMEAQRANPKYFTEIKDSGGTGASREGIDFDFYADAVAAETSDDMKFQRNKTELSMLENQKGLYESYLNPRHAAASSSMLSNVTQLPTGHSVKNGTTNTGRNDLVNVHKLMQEEVCATFGVPRSMMFADGPSNRGNDTVGSHQTFMHTLLWWKKKLGVILSECYNSINAEKIVEKIDVKKNQCMDELKRKYKINVYFPVTPFVSNDELRKLYEQGVISWKSYGEYALRNISLPIDDLQPKPPEVDELLFKKPEVKPAQQPAAPESEPNDKKRKAEESSDQKDAKKDKKDAKENGKKDKKDVKE